MKVLLAGRTHAHIVLLQSSAPCVQECCQGVGLLHSRPCLAALGQLFRLATRIVGRLVEFRRRYGQIHGDLHDNGALRFRLEEAVQAIRVLQLLQPRLKLFVPRCFERIDRRCAAGFGVYSDVF